jgi:hypothetical protein
MATLSANITASQTVIPVSGAASQTGSFFTVDSEAIRFLGTSRGPQGRSFLRDYWSVDRGVAGTTASTHSNGATLTQYYPDAASAPAARGLAIMAVRDNTGGNVTVTAGTMDPTPVTVYTVIRDDLGAAADTSDYPLLPAGVYLVGGYVDWVPTLPAPTGLIAADMVVATDGLYPEGDLGTAVWHDLSNMANVIVAPTKLVTVNDETEIHMRLHKGPGGLSQAITWVRWVFWAVQVVAQ